MVTRVPSCSVATLPELVVTLSLACLWADSHEPGLIVEEVGKYSEAEKAGLQTADVLLTWSRTDAQGELNSPFDLAAIEFEQSPQGAVILKGRRGSAEREWVLGPPAWGITTRPHLPPQLQEAYNQGRILHKAGRLSEAADHWLAAAEQVQKPESGVWLLSRAAEAYAEARQWNKADNAYGAAIDRVSTIRLSIAAQLLNRRASLFTRQNAWAEAEKDYELAIHTSQKQSPESLIVGRTLRDLGRMFELHGDLTKADEFYRKALAMQERLGPGSLEVARTLISRGDVACARGDFETADKLVLQALAISEKLAPDGLEVARVLNIRGLVAWARGDLVQAEENYRRVLVIYAKFVPGTLDVAKILNNHGLVTWWRGDLSEAEQYFRQAMVIYDKLAPDSLEMAASLNNLGGVIDTRGDLATAEAYYHQALAIRETLAPGSLQIAWSLNNLGLLSYAQGDISKAKQYFERALEISEKIAPASREVAMRLYNLGNVARQQGNLDAAREYHERALAIRRTLGPGTLEVARSLRSFGQLAHDRHELAEAERYYRDSLAILNTFAPGKLDGAHVLNDLGRLASDRGRLTAAEEYHRQALAITEKLVPESTAHIDSLYSLGSVLRRQGRLAEAASLLSRAIDALENQTGRLGGNEELRSGFRARHAGYYRDYVDLLAAQGQSEAAFHVLERSRARSLLALLAERDIIFAADLPVEIRRVRQHNAAAYDRLQAQIAELNPAKDAARTEQLTARLRELNDERSQIAEQVKRASPRLAALQYPEPLDLAGAREALDSGTVLLSYSVGPDEAFLFVVQAPPSEPGLSVFRLPVGDKELRLQVEDFRSLIEQRGASARVSLTQRARALYDLLLRPAEAHLASSDRVLLIPDGPLHFLPFAALLRDEKQYLIEWKPLHAALSATIYAQLKKTGRETKGEIELIAFGDPRYPRPNSYKLGRSADATVRSAREGGVPLDRLPFSRKEVETIAALYPGRSQTYLGAEATEERAKSLGGAKYLHFATHGVLDQRFPLNSALVMTIPEEVKEGQENGLLQAWEIFEQARWDAQLVVLSACESGLGQEVSGEGLVGLTRALHYAGARSVLASLWSIEDRRTAQLMEQFYKHLRQGASKDDALRAAQLKLIQSPAGARPYYWAAFSLSGDWR